MKVAIHTWGSEGDVRPATTLCEKLVSAGHEVRLTYVAADGREYGRALTNAPFVHREVSTGVPRAELQQLAGEVFSDTSPIRQLDRVLEALLLPSFDALSAAAEDDVRWAEVVVAHPLALPLLVAAEAAQKPAAMLFPVMMLPTSEVHAAGLPNLGPLNRLGWWLVWRMLSRRLDAPVAGLRKRFGLTPPRSLVEQLAQSSVQLVAISPTLLPRPIDWAPNAHVTGFLGAPPSSRDAPLEPAVAAFLEAGPPPVYVSFGSMSETERDPTEALRIVERAVDLAGCRAIIQGGEAWAKAEPRPNVLKIARSSHDAVFPRCALIVHHGGAGTTQTTLRAGRAAVIVAHMVDQTWWGQRLARLGVAPPALTRAKLAAEPLAKAIKKALADAKMRSRAEALGAAMRTEDGPGRALELIESLRRA